VNHGSADQELIGICAAYADRHVGRKAFVKLFILAFEVPGCLQHRSQALFERRSVLFPVGENK